MSIESPGLDDDDTEDLLPLQPWQWVLFSLWFFFPFIALGVDAMRCYG